MPRDKGDAALLLDMPMSAQTVARYITGKSQNDYLRDEMLRDAIERRAEIVGEAARALSSDFRDTHSEIPWRPIMATRHILAHAYDVGDDAIIYRVATTHIPD